MSNPFNPAPGALPARIVGRESELSAMRESIRRVKSGSAPTPLVFIGQRGMGKTVLLRELRDLGGRDTLAIPIEILRSQPLSHTLQEKLDDLLASVETLPKKAGHLIEKALKSLPKLSYELPNDAGAFAIAGSGESRTEHESLTTMLRALGVAARSAKRYITLTIDEIQDADIRSLETLVRFVHESAQSDAPILLACAGLSESYVVLQKLRTYVQRWTTFDLRFLSESESIEAIREPIIAANARIEEAALLLLAEEAGGYPFFIQTYASAAWETSDGRFITLADVEASLPDVRRRNEFSFYVRPLARMSPRETLFAIALAELGPGPHDIGAIARALGVGAPDVSSIRLTLVRKAIVAVPIPGKVEFRIPFTDRYLRAHRSEYETSEVAAYRSELARRSSSRGPR
jgi:hypothetical protein